MEIFLSCVDIFLRSLFSLAALFLLSKMIGARQISQMTFFDYIVGITIGSIAAEAAIDREIPFYLSILSMAVYALLTLLIAWMTNNSISARRFFTGIPRLLIDNGEIIGKNLKRNHLDVNELLSCARVKGYFDISTIAYAVMEPNGTISFLPRKENTPLTPADMGKHPQTDGLLANIIMDGVLMSDNLEKINKTEKWLVSELRKQGYKSFSEVFLAVCDEGGSLTVFGRNKKPEKGWFI